MNKQNSWMCYVVLVASVGLFALTRIAYCQQRATYRLTKQDIERIQINAEALRAANQSGWEQGYVAIAQEEWKSLEHSTSLSRLLTVMRETQDCEWRARAYRVAHNSIVKLIADPLDDKEAKQLEEQFTFHTSKILFDVPVNVSSMASGCASSHARILASAAHFWEKRDQGASERAAETMMSVAVYMPDVEADRTRADAQLILARIHEKRGKYELALTAYDNAIAYTNFTLLEEVGELARETMLTERVRLLSLSDPGTPTTRAAILSRTNELNNGTNLPWLSRAELFASLLQTLAKEQLHNVRINGMIHFVQTSPQPPARTQEEDDVVLDFLSRMQSADQSPVNRPDAALLSHDILITRTTNHEDRDRLIQQRDQLLARMNQ